MAEAFSLSLPACVRAAQMQSGACVCVCVSDANAFLIVWVFTHAEHASVCVCVWPFVLCFKDSRRLWHPHAVHAV